jgi:hypothetical protein
LKRTDEQATISGNPLHGVEAGTMQQTQQATAPKTQPFGEETFGPSDRTTLRWLGMAGFTIGMSIMIGISNPSSQGIDHERRAAAVDQL